MSQARRLPSDPHAKSGVWIGGSLLMGYAGYIFLLKVLSMVGGGFLDLSLWGYFIILVLFGFGLSVPYGLAWVRGDVKPKEGAGKGIDVASLPRGEPGSNYVIIDERGGRKPRWLKPKEHGLVAHGIYAVLWKGPVVLGDAVLTAIWNAIAGFRGRQGEGSISTASVMDEGWDERAEERLRGPENF